MPNAALPVAPVSPPPSGIGIGLQWLIYLAIGVGMSSAYDIQTVLPPLAQAFGLPVSQVGTYPALTQLGVWFGVFLLLPLGDLRAGRSLLVALFLINGALLVALALSPRAHWLAVSCVLVGATAIAPYLLPPLISKLASDEQRAALLARMTTAVFVGIVVARAVSGYLSGLYGWQAPFWLSAALCVVVAIALRWRLPLLPVKAAVSYGALIRSLWDVARRERPLRDAALLQGLQFASFNLFWLALPLYLTSPAHRLPESLNAMFGLIGLLGVITIPLLARQVSRLGIARTALIGACAVKLAWLCAAVLHAHLWGLALAGVLMNFGVAATHVANQSCIFSLCQGLRSRLGALYAMGIFTGGFIASPVSTWIWSHWGWLPLCVTGGALAVLTTAMLAVRVLGHLRAAQSVQAAQAAASSTPSMHSMAS